MAEINNDEKRIGVSGEQIEEAVGKVPTIEADVKANKQNISALQTASAQHTADISSVNATLENKANADEVYSREETDNAITAKVAEIVAGAPEEFDTLKEMSDWLTEHSGSAAEMNTAIQTNTKAIADNAKAIEGNTAEIANNKSDILSDENAIAINRATLGTQKKNLFNKDGEINLIYTGGKQPNSSLYSTVSGNVITFKAAITKANMSGQFIPNVKNKKIIISGNLSSIESSTSGDSLAIRAYIRKNETHIFNTRRGTTGEFSYTVDCGENNEVFICMGLFYGDGLVKVENLMVRYADITDGTYEPYTPSLQEQINALVAEIAELKANLTVLE